MRHREDEMAKAKAKRAEQKAEHRALQVRNAFFERHIKELERENESLRQDLVQVREEKEMVEMHNEDMIMDQENALQEIERLRSEVATANHRIGDLEACVEAEFALRMMAEAARDARRLRREFG